MKCALFHPAGLVHWAQKNACPGGKTTMKKTFFLLCALLLVLGTLTSVITCGFTHKYITLLMDSLLPFAASLFCMSFLLVAGMLVSMSITGTVFTNMGASSAVGPVTRVTSAPRSIAAFASRLW